MRERALILDHGGRTIVNAARTTACRHNGLRNKGIMARIRHEEVWNESEKYLQPCDCGRPDWDGGFRANGCANDGHGSRAVLALAHLRLGQESRRDGSRAASGRPG